MAIILPLTLSERRTASDNQDSLKICLYWVYMCTWITNSELADSESPLVIPARVWGAFVFGTFAPNKRKLSERLQFTEFQ